MKMYGVCLEAVCPIRKSPTHTAEMVSQLLFGETYEVLTSTSEWIEIQTTSDNYNGFISSKQATLFDEVAFLVYKNAAKELVSTPLCRLLNIADNSTLYVPAGAELGLESRFCIAGHWFARDENLTTPTWGIVPTAMQFMNAPYLWGGRTILGIDCSGFVQLVYKLNNHSLPRDAYQQVALGKSIDTVAAAVAGDVAFFANPQGRIVHTGILLGNGQIIHASGKVRIDTIDDKGIFNAELQTYTHTLHSIKRIILQCGC